LRPPPRHSILFFAVLECVFDCPPSIKFQRTQLALLLIRLVSLPLRWFLRISITPSGQNGHTYFAPATDQLSYSSWQKPPVAARSPPPPTSAPSANLAGPRPLSSFAQTTTRLAPPRVQSKCSGTPPPAPSRRPPGTRHTALSGLKPYGPARTSQMNPKF